MWMNIFSVWLLPDYIEDSWICDYACRNFSEFLKVNTMDFVIKLQKVTIFIINDTLGFPPLTRDSKKSWVANFS